MWPKCYPIKSDAWIRIKTGCVLICASDLHTMYTPECTWRSVWPATCHQWFEYSFCTQLHGRPIHSTCMKTALCTGVQIENPVWMRPKNNNGTITYSRWFPLIWMPSAVFAYLYWIAGNSYSGNSWQKTWLLGVWHQRRGGILQSGLRSDHPNGPPQGLSSPQTETTYKKNTGPYICNLKGRYRFAY